MAAMVHFIGAGPGDPELITIKGQRLIEEADVIIFAGSLVNPAVLDKRKKDSVFYDSAYMSLDEVMDVTIPAVKDFAITDADYADYKQMVKDSDFKYDRLSEKRLADLKKVAEHEGYYEEAKPEFEALEKKLAHNLDLEMDRRQKDIRRLMANEVLKRYYYQAGMVEEALKDDEDLDRAIELLHNESEYKTILNK